MKIWTPLITYQIFKEIRVSMQPIQPAPHMLYRLGKEFSISGTSYQTPWHLRTRIRPNLKHQASSICSSAKCRMNFNLLISQPLYTQCLHSKLRLTTLMKNHFLSMTEDYLFLTLFCELNELLSLYSLKISMFTFDI